MRIVVIGAGLQGIATAWYLCQQGHEVMVLDHQDGPGLGTSYANGGMLTPSQSAPWNAPGVLLKVLKSLGQADSPFLIRPERFLPMLIWGFGFLRHTSQRAWTANLRKNARLAIFSLAELDKLDTALELDYDRSSRGTLKLYRDRREFDRAVSELAEYRDTGCRHVLLDREALLSCEPSLVAGGEHFIGGIHFPDDGSGDARKFCTALAGQAQKAGVEFRFGIRALRFISRTDVITALLTEQGTLQADAWVLAAGPWSRALAATIGLRLPIYPVKGYSLSWTLDDSDKLPQLPVIDESTHIAVTPLGNTLRVAGKAELAGYDLRIAPDRVALLARYAAVLFPGLSEHLRMDQAQTWSGLRPYCSDGVPLLGRHRLQNLYLNTGQGHLGWTLAAGSARLVADQISGRRSELDIQPYSPSRFG